MRPKIFEIMRGIVFNALRVADIGLIMVSFGLAVVLSINAGKWTTIEGFFASKVSLSSCALFAIAILLCHAMFSLSGLYQSKRMSTKRSEAADVLRAMTFSTACLWCEGKLFSILVMTPYFLVAFWAIGSASVIVMRLLLRSVLGLIRKRGRNLHHVLVLGTNARAITFGRKVNGMPDRGYRLVGFVDNDWPRIEEFKATGFRLACDYEGLADFLRHNVVDELAMFLPLRSFYERAAEIAKLTEQHGIILQFDKDIFDLKLVRARNEVMDDASQMAANSSGIDERHLLLKRMLDFVGSLVLLILLAPLFLVVAVLIKLTSPGPVFFAQQRVGLNKRHFTMFKFRTMVSRAEAVQESLLHLNEMTGPVFKMRNDPRITPLGRVLRRTSIDELPQLFNVLKGDMSLVGPRAMSVRDYQFFSEDWQRRRFSVPPGITCLWQIQGRNRIPFEQWMVLDMQYIDGWSLWLDLKILALTIPAVLRGSGAA
jgi:exopolysaccharide biosynthesis polyprenyl glycosylphosphotransferase